MTLMSNAIMFTIITAPTDDTVVSSLSAGSDEVLFWPSVRTTWTTDGPPPPVEFDEPLGLGESDERVVQDPFPLHMCE